MPSACTKRSASRRLLGARQEAPHAQPRLQRQRDVLAHRQLGHDAVGLALFRAQRQAVRDRVGRAGEVHGLAVDRAARRASGASRPNSRRASSVRPEPSSPARPDDLAGAHAAGRSAASGRPGPGPRPAAAPARRRRRRARGAAPPTAPPARAPPWRRSAPAGPARPPRHSPTQLPLRSTVMRSDTAYTWFRKCVTNTIAMPSPRRRRSTSNSLLHLVVVQAGGRLVEDQHLGLHAQRARDRHHLLHRHRVARQQPRRRRCPGPDARQQLARLPVHRRPVDAPALRQPRRG